MMSRRRTPSSTDRVGDAIGVGAAIIGTVAVHLAMFGGDRYFPLRFLLFPLDNVIAFSAFWISTALLVIAIVRATRTRAWAVLSPNTAQPVDTASPAEVAKRALRAAAIIAALNALFMIVFVIGAVVAFVVIFLIAAALIAGVYIVLKALAPSGR